MPQIAPDYSKVFNRLCHLIALTQQGKTRVVIDNLVLTVFAIQPDLAPTTATEVAEAINETFGLTLRPNAIQSTLDRYVRDGRLLRDAKTRIYYIAQHEKAVIEQRVADATQLEDRVRDQWIASLNESHPLLTDRFETLWHCLRAYMAKVFRRHGAETIQLLRPSVPNGEAAARGLSALLAEAMHETSLTLDERVASEIVASFFLASTPDRTRYIAQLLDGTFSFFALTIDDDISDYLRDNLPPLMLFLDTNFIFAIIGINTNQLADVSQEVLELIKTHGLPFRLYYHEETLQEMDRTVYAIGRALMARRWDQALSRAAVTSGQFGGLVLRYHEKNAVNPVDVDIFMSKYNYIPDLLEEYGFRQYPAATDTGESIMQKGSLIAQYDEYVREIRPDHRPKPQAALNHDITVWLAVQKLRKPATNALASGALILSNDGLFQRFDRQKLREMNRAGSVVLSNHLLQLLRPFVPATDDFDRRFVETFAIPEFRTSADFSDIPSRVLGYLSEYSSMPEKTAVRILSDQVAIARLRTMDPDSEEFKATLEATVNQELLEENYALEAENERTRDALAERGAQLSESQALIARSAREKSSADQQIEAIEAKLRALTDQSSERASAQAAEIVAIQGRHEAQAAEIRALREQKQRADRRTEIVVRSALAVCVGIAGIAAIIFFAVFGTWELLRGHPHRPGLVAVACYIWAGTMWAIADRDTFRRGIAIGTLVLGALLVIPQIL